MLLANEEGINMESDDDTEELNLLDQLKDLNLEDDDPNLNEGINQQEVESLAEATKGILTATNPIFNKDRESSKIKIILTILKQNVLPSGDKVIIVSQWTSFLKLIALHLKEEGILYEQLDGSVPVFKRMGMVENFNDPFHKTKVGLLKNKMLFRN